MERTWQQPSTYTGTGEAMKAVGQARLELSGVSTPDHLWPPLINNVWSVVCGVAGEVEGGVKGAGANTAKGNIVA